MSSLQEQLYQVRWKSLTHAYGPATDTPDHLLALLSDDEEVRDQALEQLRASICHQGSVYEASAAAVPFLIQLLEQVPEEQQPPLLDLLDGLAVRHWYAERDLPRLRMVGTDQQRRQSYGQFLQEGNRYHRPEWMELSHACVGDGIAVLLSLLHSTNRTTVSKTLRLLSAFQERNQAIVPALMAFLTEQDDAEIQALALRCLGALLEAEAAEWQEYKRLIALPADQIHASVRFAAAETVANYHPGEASAEIIELLIEHMLQPYALDLQVLSQLGMPTGWQALIRLLERGASHWSLLDTIRVVEAVLDLAFFGGWVENRYWNYRRKSYGQALLRAHEIAGGEPPTSTEIEDIPDLAQGAATFSWQYGIMGSYPPQPDELLIEVWGYDRAEARALAQRYEQEGAQALSEEQQEAIRVVLNCQPLWQYPQNLMAIYGLPITHQKLAAFLPGEKAVE